MLGNNVTMTKYKWHILTIYNSIIGSSIYELLCSGCLWAKITSYEGLQNGMSSIGHQRGIMWMGLLSYNIKDDLSCAYFVLLYTFEYSLIICRCEGCPSIQESIISHLFCIEESTLLFRYIGTDHFSNIP